MEEKLIEVVRHHTILYDTSDKEYMKTKLKSEKWNEIAKAIHLNNGVEAKVMWDKLRHSYRDALRRQQKCLKSGAAAKTIRPWKFQNQMNFLKPFMANRSREGNLQDGTDNEELSVKSQIMDTETEFGENSGQGNINNEVEDNEHDQDMVENIEEVEASQYTAIPSTSKCRNTTTQNKTSKKDDITKLLRHSMLMREQRAKQRETQRNNLLEETRNPRDSLYHFFISMYEMTRTMPASAQHFVRNNIYQTVTQMEASLLNIQPHYPQPSAAQSQPQLNLISLQNISNTNSPNLHNSTHTRSYTPQSSYSEVSIDGIESDSSHVTDIHPYQRD